MLKEAFPYSSARVSEQKPTLVRHGVVVFLSLACSSAYLTRHCISVANTTIQRELHFTTEQMGWILSMFMLGYLFCQIPGGWLGTRWGARIVLPLLSVVWSLLTAAITLVSSYLPMVALRGAFGGAQAGLVPNAALVVNHWTPLARRGVISAFMGIAMSGGAIVTMGLTAKLLEYSDWRTVFQLYSLVGVVWAVLFFLYFRNRPNEHPRVNQAERDLILAPESSRANIVAPDILPSHAQAQGKASAGGSSGMWARMIQSRNMWLICSQQFFSAAAYSLFLTWFPAFLEKGYGLTRENAGLMAMSPLFAALIGYLAGGLVLDVLLAKTGNKRVSRSVVGFGAMILCGLFMLASTWTSSPGQLVAVMTVGVLLYAPSGPASWAVAIDIAGKNTALVMAVMNMAGVTGAFLSPALVGYLIAYIERSSGDWNLVIYLFAAMYFASGLFWSGIDSRKKLADD